MILPFSTKMNGKPTYFVEKIWEGLLRNIFEGDAEYQQYLSLHKNQFEEYWDDDHKSLGKPKLHTIREDIHDRWKAGNKIDFFINCRQKDMFRFAPVLPVVSVQKIIIKQWNGKPQVYIDESPFPMQYMSLVKLAQNDGFDTIEDFFAYFNEDFKGKIIHWTDLRY